MEFGSIVHFEKALTRVFYRNGRWECCGPRRRDSVYRMPATWDSRLFTAHSGVNEHSAWRPEMKPFTDSHEPITWFNLPFEGAGIVIARSTVQSGYRAWGSYDDGGNIFIQEGTLPVVIVAIKSGVHGPALVRLDPAEVKQ